MTTDDSTMVLAPSAQIMPPPVVAPVVPPVDGALSAQEATRLSSDENAYAILSHVMACFNYAETGRAANGHTDRLLDAQRRKNGQYTSARRTKLEKYGYTPAWVPHTARKCFHAKAWTRDYLATAGPRLFTIQPSVEPELNAAVRQKTAEEVAIQWLEAMMNGESITPQQGASTIEAATKAMYSAVKREASERAQRMEKRVQDTMDDPAAGFLQALDNAIDNAITYGTFILKGPVVRNVKRAEWTPENRRIVTRKRVLCSEAPSPLDMYYAPWSRTGTDGYVIERIRTHPSALRDLIGIEGSYYNDAAIKEILAVAKPHAPESRIGDAERDERERKAGDTSKAGMIEGFEFYDALSGALLNEWTGFEDMKPDEFYDVKVTVLDKRVIQVQPTWNELSPKPYFIGPYKAETDSPYGVGIPLMMADAQDTANGAKTYLGKHMEWVSGGMTYAASDRLADPDEAGTIFPGKHWITKTDAFGNNTAPPIGMIQMPSSIADFLNLLATAEKDADNQSGIPSYQEGGNVQNGAAATVGGLQLLLATSARGMKDFWWSLDQLGIAPLVRNYVEWFIQYDTDDSIKGDMQVVCNGAMGVFMREIQLTELTNLMNITNNPTDMAIFGPKLRAMLIQRWAEFNRFPLSDVLPTDDALKAVDEAVRTAKLREVAGESGGPASRSEPVAGGENNLGTPRRAAFMERVPAASQAG